MDGRFFTLQTEAQQQFFKIPKAFMCKDSKYYSMDAMSKMLYGILADRNSLSMKNGWVDELGRIYFIYNQADLCDVMGLKSAMTLRKHLKELEKNGLLFRQRMGQSMPDRLYLLQVEAPQTLINTMIDKIYPSRQIKNIHQDRQNLSTNKTEKNKTESINSSSKKSEAKQTKKSQEEEDKINRILSHCKKCNFRLQKRTIEQLILSYDIESILKAITTAGTVAGDRIKNPSSYLMAILNDKGNNTTKQHEEQTTNRFNDFEQRNYTKSDMSELELSLLSRTMNQ